MPSVADTKETQTHEDAEAQRNAKRRCEQSNDKILFAAQCLRALRLASLRFFYSAIEHD